MTSTLAAQFETLRVAHGLSKAAFARSLDVSESTVGRWEEGSIPEEKHRVVLSRLYGVTLDLLTEGESDVLTAVRAARGSRCLAVGPEGNRCEGDAGHLGKPFPVGGSHYHGGMCWVDDAAQKAGKGSDR